IAFSGVDVSAADVLGEPGRGLATIRRVNQAGIMATCAEAVGAMEAMLNMTVEYMKTRVQFGRPIGENQALQHRATEMMIALEQGRSLAMLAAVMVDDENAEQRDRDLSTAKVGVGQAARFVSQNAVQLHGGIGMTDEYAVGHYFRRCMVIEHSFGDTGYHLSKLADAIA
ncbi:MAG TPA: acyl-CoA dehydrogenase family protein, partial [Stellaceae bacterium]|nr:acyl-CoA dehydrogenase family protein [Stellaceae bacterium]